MTVPSHIPSTLPAQASSMAGAQAASCGRVKTQAHRLFSRAGGGGGGEWLGKGGGEWLGDTRGCQQGSGLDPLSWWQQSRALPASFLS